VKIEIRTKIRPAYAHVFCSGEFTFDFFVEMLESAFGIAADSHRQAVLVDIRELKGEQPTVGERYDCGVRIAELQRGIGKGILMAFVGHEPLIDPERLAEIVAKSHGAFLGVFTEIDEATAWIEKEVAKQQLSAKSLHILQGSA